MSGISANDTRLQDIAGIQFNITETGEDSLKVFNRYKFERIHLTKSNTPFSKENVGDIQPRVKHTHRISFEEGTALARLASTKTGK